MCIRDSNYESAFQKLPAGISGDPFLGITAQCAVLPYLEQENVFGIYDTDRTGLENTNATVNEIPSFVCPSDDAAGRTLQLTDTIFVSRSNYVVCYGSASMLADRGGAPFWRNHNPDDFPNLDYFNDGPFGIEESRTFGQLEDGSSNIIFVSEVLSGKDDFSIIGQDFDTDIRGVWCHFLPGSSNYNHLSTPNSSVADHGAIGGAGRQWFQNRPDINMPAARGDDYNDYHAAARSNHPGGVTVCYGDGHTSFASDSVLSLIHI